MSDSYPWLLQSLDEPEPANVSRIKTKPDRQTQEFCHSVCHPFASKPNLCRSQKPRVDGGKETFSGWTSGCVTPPECRDSWNVEDVHYSGAPVASESLSLLSYVQHGRGHHGNTKHINRVHHKGYEVPQQHVLPGSRWSGWGQRILDATWYLEIKYWVLQFICKQMQLSRMCDTISRWLYCAAGQ